MPGGSGSRESPCSAQDLGSIPGSGRYPGEGNGYPLQFSCLGKPGKAPLSMGSQRVRHN